MKRVLTILVTVGICAGALHAALTPEQEAAARIQMALFTSRQFKVRQEAVEKLVALGPDVVPLVKGKLAETEDREVKMRCRMVLKGIRERYIVGANDERINVGASRHTLTLKAAPVKTALDDLARAAGNAPIAIKGTGAAKLPVTLALNDVRYWEAVDRIAAAAKLGYAYDYATTRHYLYPRPQSGRLTAYAGPAVVKAYVVSRSVTVINGSNRGSLTFHFFCMCEERLPVIFAAVVVTKVAAPGGKTVTVKRATTKRPLWATPTIRYTATATGPQDLGIRSADIEGFVMLEHAVGRREAVVRDVFAAKPEPFTVGGLTLNVTAAKRVGREVRVTVEGTTKGACPSFVTNNPDYGLFLRDAAGKQYKLRRGAGPYVTGGYKSEVIFAVDKAPGPYALVLVHPERTGTREHPFVLSNVPVP